jgi:hypothetical protein
VGFLSLEILCEFFFAFSSYWVRDFSLPGSLVNSHPRESERKYTHSKEREKLTTKYDKIFIKKCPGAFKMLNMQNLRNVFDKI